MTEQQATDLLAKFDTLLAAQESTYLWVAFLAKCAVYGFFAVIFVGFFVALSALLQMRK